MEISVNNISKKYRKKQVLTNVSFCGKSGTCIGILGANGSGKSTLLNILAGIISSDSGSFEYNGADMLKKRRKADKIGFVPQGIPLIEELTAYDNLLIWYRKRDLQKELAVGTLKMLGINEFIKTPVSKMSGGMKKRLSIGCAVARRPEVLLLDEPGAALDLECKSKIIDYIDSFKKNGGLVIMATHDLQEIDVCDCLYILKNGSLKPFDYNGDIHMLIENL